MLAHARRQTRAVSTAEQHPHHHYTVLLVQEQLTQTSATKRCCRRGRVGGRDWVSCWRRHCQEVGAFFGRRHGAKRQRHLHLDVAGAVEVPHARQRTTAVHNVADVELEHTHRGARTAVDDTKMNLLLRHYMHGCNAQPQLRINPTVCCTLQ